MPGPIHVRNRTQTSIIVRNGVSYFHSYVEPESASVPEVKETTTVEETKEEPKKQESCKCNIL